MQQEKPDIDLDQIYQEYRDLPQKFDSLFMATVSEDGVPDASYAPYVKNKDDYYVFISELSIHTNNVAKTGQISILFIENEDKARHLFARKRVTLQCEASEIGSGTEQYKNIMSLFSNKFGKFMRLLEENQDFHLYRIQPLKGAYVAGFGRAFTIEGKKLGKIRHVNDMGHKASENQSKQHQATQA
jgi:putative heme iron utilization protein